MIGDYTLEPHTYGVHRRCVRLVEIVEAPPDKYMGNDISHRKGLINLWPSSSGQLMEARDVQQDRHTPGTHEEKNREPTWLKYFHFAGYVRIRSRVTRSGPESYHICTTSFSGGKRGR